MNKNSKNKLYIIIFLVAIFAVSFGVAKYYNLSVAQGFFVLSAGQTDYISNDSQLGGNWWLVTVSQNGAGNYIAGTFDGTQIKDVSYNSKYPLTLEATLLDNRLEYNILKQNNYVKHLNFEEQRCGIICDWTARQQNCKSAHSASDTIAVMQDGWGAGIGYCVWFTNDRPIGEFDTLGNYVFNTQLKSTANGVSAEGTISNSAQSSVWVGDKIYATWVGSLVSGISNPDLSRYDTIWIGGEGWKTVDSTAMSNYQSYYSSGLMNCLVAANTMYIDELSKRCFDQFDTLETSALSTKSISVSGGLSSRINGTVDSGKLIIDLPYQMQFPVLSMKIRASYIGVVQLAGRPKIVSVNAPSEMNSGKAASVTLNVQNIGDADGAFDIATTCDSGLSAAQTYRINVAKSSTVSAYVSLVGSTTEDKTVKCTFTVSDVNNPNNKDTASAYINLKTITVCTADEMQCNGMKIEKCNAAGSKFEFVENCLYGCKMDGSTAKCVTATKCENNADCDDADDCTQDHCVVGGMLGNYCKNEKISMCGGFGDLVALLPWILLLVVIVVIALVVNKKRSQRNRGRR